ncbi:MAG: biotin transporter BioY [Pleurocapsa minor GSE-CHR-MK-17-07R]|jgi:biotin transport system substrate-specific component|nr:biotin transporter BioY [Pleurocapsa minor GSE-CHR-MK 17-07R]
MLRTVSNNASSSLAVRVGGIFLFAALSAAAARITIPVEPVPFTLQTLAVVLAGMTLGARDGALSQLIYVALIAVGLPIDARGVGQASLFGPTGGYLVGFIAAAFVSGLLVERAGVRVWQRWLAGLAGMLVIYAFGATWLAVSRGMTPDAAFSAGVTPFIVGDLAKAMIAAGATEGMRLALRR